MALPPNITDEAGDPELLDEPKPKYEAKAVKATSDERTVNNVMRHEYRVLSDDEKAQMQRIKDLGVEMEEALSKLPPSREVSLAKTKNEEAVMWAVKAITQ